MSITARGGYQIVDFKNVVLTTSGVEIPGIYEQAKNCANKPVQVTNITLDVQGSVRHMNTAQFIMCIFSGTAVGGDINLGEVHIMVTISNDDTVSYRLMA